jgi:tRNA A-37 threonylcarbamoyl transferase component Bud32
MENNILTLIQELSWTHLRQANRATLTPFQLALTDSDVPLICKEIIRVVPGKRVVATGTWGNKAVIAKLFYESRHAARHANRDAKGIEALATNGVLTPTLYYQGTSVDKRIHVLIFEKIIDAQSLDTLWQERQTIKELLPVLQAVTIEIATHHVLGILQHDLHLKNFLIKDARIYTIDGGDIEIASKPLSKKDSINNLGLFFAQFGIGVDELQKLLFQIYTRARGWIVKEKDLTDLADAIKHYTATRWEQYSKKIFRTCTAFVRTESTRSITVYDRDYESSAFFAFLQNPDAIFAAPETELLKAGRSSTVVKVKIADQWFVIKRYNIKNIWHGLRRCLRTTRAAKSWRLAQRLRLMGIPTAKPIAFVEKRFLGFRGKSYLLMEYIEGEHAGDFFSHSVQDAEHSLFTCHQVIALFENLAQLHITHGDLKMTNILIAKHKPWLIDLDGMKEHRHLLGFKRVFQNEIKRFMENWRHVPTVHDMFEQLVVEMYKRLEIKH